MDLSSRIIVNLFKVQNIVDLSAEPTRLIAHHVLESEFSELDTSTTLAEKGCKTRANHQRQGRTVIAGGGGGWQVPTNHKLKRKGCFYRVCLKN